MLEAQGKYNHLSSQLRSYLEEEAAKAGRVVKFKFAIARLNPDGEQKAGGKYLYPLSWSLTPVTFQILDPGDKKLKTIGMVKHLKEEGHESDALHRVVLREAWQGKLPLDMSIAEDREQFAFILLHPKLAGGKFYDAQQPPLITRIDEKKQATEQLKTRKLRVDAMYVAANMMTQEIKDFSCAMGWNEHDEEVILRDRIVELADKDPEFFKNFIDNKNIEYRAVVQRAMDNNIIAFLPVESKFVWVSNGSPIAVLERTEGGNILERMCDWVMTSKNGLATFEKIKGLLSENAKATA